MRDELLNVSESLSVCLSKLSGLANRMPTDRKRSVEDDDDNNNDDDNSTTDNNGAGLCMIDCSCSCCCFASLTSRRLV
jgi:hypothetical protein